MLVLFGLITFYAFATGFAFFFKLLYVLILLAAVGFAWAWLNLRGIQIQLTRLSQRGQVGGYLEGQMRVNNLNRLPKSWLEVTEVSDIPGYSSGRGIGLVKEQSRSWRIETYLSRRGAFTVGQVEVTSQDPFGMFRLKRRFLEPKEYIVLPAAEPLPNLDPRLANLPADSRVNRRTDNITPDTSTVREYSYGDSYRRIHWPYTARMNTLMVKEFDMGISAESWVLLDMYRSSHVSLDDAENTEELAVTIAASLIGRLTELSMSVGLAANGQQMYIQRPDSSPAQAGRLMEALATVRALGNVTLERFIYDLRPHLTRFNTLTVITPSRRTEWIAALSNVRRQGVSVAAIYIDPVEFGASAAVESPVDFLANNEIATYVVKRGQDLNEALRSSVNAAAPAFLTSVGAPSNPETANDPG
ncbi:MAG: DUF58 domain-containing protein [Chloroflexi bacterium]|nr:DUF58 domain-containing protein [Chloroflexota bacterium]